MDCANLDFKLQAALRIMSIMVKDVCYWLKKPTTATFTLLTVQQSFDSHGARIQRAAHLLCHDAVLD
jgi:hypothetical protein